MHPAHSPPLPSVGIQSKQVAAIAHPSPTAAVSSPSQPSPAFTRALKIHSFSSSGLLHLWAHARVCLPVCLCLHLCNSTCLSVCACPVCFLCSCHAGDAEVRGQSRAWEMTMPMTATVMMRTMAATIPTTEGAGWSESSTLCCCMAWEV